MKKEILKIIEHFSERKSINNKTRVSIFFICFSISLFIWFLIKMSQDYSSEVKFPIHYYNAPTGQIHTVTYDSIITVKLNARGFDLLNLSFFKKPAPIQIDLSGSIIRKDRYSMSSYILSNNVNTQVIEQIDFTDKITEISPDTLRFDLERIISKEVPIVEDIEITLKSQFQFYGDIELFPRNVIISGPPSIIDTIQHIYTTKQRFANADYNIEARVKLKKPNNNKVFLSFDSIDLFAPIEKFTENTAKIPINVLNDSEGIVKLFPDVADVKYLIALKDYSNFQDEMLSLGVNFDKTKIRQNVEVINQPSFIKITNIQPQTVEYIMIK